MAKGPGRGGSNKNETKPKGNDSLEKTLKKYNAQIVSWGQDTSETIPAWDTGILGLNIAVGVGGFPKGRVIELSGPPSMGKTLVALMAIKTAQKKYKKKSLFIDAEQATPRSWLLKQGIDLSMLDRLEECTDKVVNKETGEELSIVRPLYAEEILEIVEMALVERDYAYIVIDSVPSLVTKDMYEATASDQSPSPLPRLLGRVLPKLVSCPCPAGTTIIFINQVRDSFNTGWGAKKHGTPGGYALKHFCSVRIEVSRVMNSVENDENDQPKSHIAMATVIKNKVAAPMRRAEFTVDYRTGITDGSEQLFEFAQNQGLIIRKGSYYFFNTEELDDLEDLAALKMQGKESMAEFIASEERVKKALISRLTRDVEETIVVASDGTQPEESTEEE